MLETIVVLTYVYSKPSSTDKVFLLCYYNITLYNANGLKISLKYVSFASLV
jgi:hypothetical protein